MKALTLMLVLGLSVAMSSTVNAAPKSKVAKHKLGAKHKRATKQAPKKSATEDLKTDVSFDDSVLHGEYQTPDEALAKVENEKGFGDLVGVRQHFKDRLQRASEQE